MAIAQARSYNRLEWLFYMVLLPALFTVILTAILLTFLGYDVKGTVFQWGNSVPYLEKVIPGTIDSTEQLAPSQDEEAILQGEFSELQEKLKQAEEQVVRLEQELQAKESQIVQLEQASQEFHQQQVNQEAMEHEVKNVARLYAEMSPSKAAGIMENLQVEEAVKILRVMNIEERGLIVGRMNPEIAAKISSQFLTRDP